MALSSPYLSTTWTRRAVAETVLQVVQDHRKAVGARLRELRKARGLSQEDAAYRVGVTVKTWGDWERGRRDPYDSNWKKIGETFEVDAATVRGTPPVPLGLGPEPDAEKLDRIEAKLDELISLARAVLSPLAGDGEADPADWAAVLEQLPEAIRETRAQRARTAGERDHPEAA